MIEYHLLKEIELNSLHTQRSLAEKLGISLGKVHYLLSGLIHKGMIEAKRLNNHPNSSKWEYFLTPQGIQLKYMLTNEYLMKRKQEYADLKKEITILEQEVALEFKRKSSCMETGSP